MDDETGGAVPAAAPAAASDAAGTSGPAAASPPPYRGRRYRRHELALAEGQRLTLRADGVIELRGADGAMTSAWTPDDPDWPGQAIRFGIRPEATTVRPDSHRGKGPNPPAS